MRFWPPEADTQAYYGRYRLAESLTKHRDLCRSCRYKEKRGLVLGAAAARAALVRIRATRRNQRHRDTALRRKERPMCWRSLCNCRRQRKPSDGRRVGQGFAYRHGFEFDLLACDSRATGIESP